MNKKILFSTLALTLLFSIIPLTFLIPVHAGSVSILSSSGWIDTTNAYHITGEVQNTGSTTVTLVTIVAKFYDAGNNILDSQFTYASLNYLQPNAKSPFSIMEWQSTIVSKIDHYTLQVSSTPSTLVSPALQILSGSLYEDALGVHAVGEIQNLGTAKSTGTEVYATFYDINGSVVDIGFSLAIPDIIASASASSFDVLCKDFTQIPLIANYSLTAESKEYELILTSSSPNATQTASPTPTLAPTSTGTPAPTHAPSTNPSPSVPEFTPLLTVMLLLILASASSVIIKIRREHNQD